MKTTKKEAVIVAYGRSAVCRAKKGSFSKTHPIEWASQVLKQVLSDVPQLNLNEISDVVVGCAMPYNELGSNTARLISIRAGIPETVCAQTINRFCSSGLQSITTCANAIISGEEDVMVAGGVEGMSQTFGIVDPKYRDPWFFDNYPGAYMGMGLTAEKVAEHYHINREEMERMAVESHTKAHMAQEKGYLNLSIVPVTVSTDDGNEKVVTLDEGIRPDTKLDSLATLKPCFKEDGVVTAATSSQTSDGAAFMILMSTEKAKSLGIKPIAKFISSATTGCDATEMGLGPVYAVPRVMQKSGFSLEDMDVIELNEAFAAQAIPCIKELGLEESKVNPWGGAMALGHPMGATGSILTCKALDYLKVHDGKYALVTMCIGGGMGAAAIFELLK